MSLTIPTVEPTTFVAGDTVPWDRYPSFAIGNFPPSEGWALSYAIRGEEVIDLSEGSGITAVTTYWEVRMTAAQTALLTEGRYSWAAFVTSGSERYQVDSGYFQVTANLVDAIPGKSYYRRMRDALRDALETAAPNALVVSFSINGRATNMDRKQALLELAGYEQKVANEEAGNVSAWRTHEVHFVNP